MSRDRILLDTSYLQARLSKRDKWHANAQRIANRIREAITVYITIPVLIETADGLSVVDRAGIYRFISGLPEVPNATMVQLDETLFDQGLRLYSHRPDKEWGLTDCISFVVMEREGIALAATADHHFVQAGFRAMMLE